MQLIIYDNFKKRVNSTKRPTGGRTIDVVLKAGTSVERPTFLINGIDLKANYCRWNNHYYYINDIMLGNKNIYEIQCTQDLMATYKDEVLSMPAYVEYSASSFNKWIPDHRLSMSNDIEVTKVTGIDCPISIVNNSCPGTYVATIAGSDTSSEAAMGMACVYGLTQGEADQFTDVLYATDLKSEIEKVFADPFKALIEAHWVPWTLYNNPTNINIGAFQPDGLRGTGINRYKTQSITTTETINLPWKYEDWRDFAPYSVMKMYLPFIGIIDLDQSKLKGQTSMTVRSVGDPISGELTYTLKCGNWTQSYSSNVAVPIAIGQTQSHIGAGTASVVGGAIGVGLGVGTMIATGGATTPAVLGAVGGVSSIGQGITTTFSNESRGAGANGSYAAVNAMILDSTFRTPYIALYSHKFGVSNPDNVNTIEGKPLYEVKTLSSLSGYVKCAGASVNIDGLAGDRIELNSIINSGFYIE